MSWRGRRDRSTGGGEGGHLNNVFAYSKLNEHIIINDIISLSLY